MLLAGTVAPAALRSGRSWCGTQACKGRRAGIRRVALRVPPRCWTRYRVRFTDCSKGDPRARGKAHDGRPREQARAPSGQPAGSVLASGARLFEAEQNPPGQPGGALRSGERSPPEAGAKPRWVTIAAESWRTSTLRREPRDDLSGQPGGRRAATAVEVTRSTATTAGQPVGVVGPETVTRVRIAPCGQPLERERIETRCPSTHPGRVAVRRGSCWCEHRRVRLRPRPWPCRVSLPSCLGEAATSEETVSASSMPDRFTRSERASAVAR